MNSNYASKQTIQDAVKTLQKAKLLLSDQEHWTTDVFARDENKTPTTTDSPNATCWCAMGAVRKSLNFSREYKGLGQIDYYKESIYSILRASLDGVAIEMGYKDRFECNDTGGFEEVHKMFDKTLKSLENLL